MNRSGTLTAALLALGVALCAAGGDEPAGEPTKASVWMKAKLTYSQNILAGLAKADFAAIRENAEAMSKFSQIEKWVRRREPGYEIQLKVFQFANEELVRQADAQNVDGAALAFTQLTLSCVNCHKEIRK